MASKQRLIDANALDFSFPLTDDMSGMLKQIGIEMVKARVMEAPTVDAAPVVHGRVVTTTDKWNVFHQNCSECGEELEWKSYPNFCRNCGAKMDGGASG